MNKKSVLIITVLILTIAIVNLKASAIVTPMRCKMEEYQIDFITINTVFAGFSFTMLGILLGLSSEELIKRIKETSIIIKQVNTIVTSIVMFMSSVAISLIFILGIDISVLKLLGNTGVSYKDNLVLVDSILYTIGIGFLIAGIVFFIISVEKFYKLIAHVYNFNSHISDGRIAKLKEALESDKEETKFDDEDELIQ